MRESGFSRAEIKLVVDDAIKLHSCHDGKSPNSQEVKILATADALAHLKTDFYLYAAWAFGENGRTLESFKNWAQPKLQRDYFGKIQFEEVRQETKKDYDLLRELLAR